MDENTETQNAWDILQDSIARLRPLKDFNVLDSTPTYTALIRPGISEAVSKWIATYSVSWTVTTYILLEILKASRSPKHPGVLGLDSMTSLAQPSPFPINKPSRKNPSLHTHAFWKSTADKLSPRQFENEHDQRVPSIGTNYPPTLPYPPLKSYWPLVPIQDDYQRHYLLVWALFFPLLLS